MTRKTKESATHTLHNDEHSLNAAKEIVYSYPYECYPSSARKLYICIMFLPNGNANNHQLTHVIKDAFVPFRLAFKMLPKRQQVEAVVVTGTVCGSLVVVVVEVVAAVELGLLIMLLLLVVAASWVLWLWLSPSPPPLPTTPGCCCCCC